jgi:hypothetical protein
MVDRFSSVQLLEAFLLGVLLLLAAVLSRGLLLELLLF